MIRDTILICEQCIVSLFNFRFLIYSRLVPFLG